MLEEIKRNKNELTVEEIIQVHQFYKNIQQILVQEMELLKEDENAKGWLQNFYEELKQMHEKLNEWSFECDD